MGLILVAISAMLLAVHWQQWHEAALAAGRKIDTRLFLLRQLRRRLVASSLVGVVGLALIVRELVPRTPLSYVAYLLSLVFAAGWIMWLGLVDWRASRRFRAEQQLNHLANELQRADMGRESSDA